MKHITVRTLLNVTAAKKTYAEYQNIRTVSVHDDIKPGIYIKQPPGLGEMNNKQASKEHLQCEASSKSVE